MFRLTACARLRANRFAAKDCRTVSVVTVSNSRSPEANPPVAVSILTNEFVGEFMRSFILAVAIAAITGGIAVAEDQSLKPAPIDKESFSKDGIYIPPGESAEIVIAGDCRHLTNTHARIGYYITPAQYDAWPEIDDRAPLEPIVTEAPCK